MRRWVKERVVSVTAGRRRRLVEGDARRRRQSRVFAAKRVMIVVVGVVVWLWLSNAGRFDQMTVSHDSVDQIGIENVGAYLVAAAAARVAVVVVVVVAGCR